MKTRLIKDGASEHPSIEISTLIDYLKDDKDVSHDELWLSEREVCLYLKVSERTLYNLTKSGKLHFSKINGHYFYTIGDVKKMGYTPGFIGEDDETNEKAPPLLK